MKKALSPKVLSSLFPSGDSPVTSLLWREGAEAPLQLHGKFGLHAVRAQNDQIDAHILAPAQEDPKETGVSMALCWVALTKLVATFPGTPPHIRDWCKQIVEEFEKVARSRSTPRSPILA